MFRFEFCDCKMKKNRVLVEMLMMVKYNNYNNFR